MHLKILTFEYLERTKSARKKGNVEDVWKLLRYAHIASQPMALPHVRVHIYMLFFALQTKNFREIFGQIIRIVLAIPGSLSGKYPRGNPGTSEISMFKTFEVPEELRNKIDGD